MKVNYRVKCITDSNCFIDRNYFKKGDIFTVILEDKWRNGETSITIMNRQTPPYRTSKKYFEAL